MATLPTVPLILGSIFAWQPHNCMLWGLYPLVIGDTLSEAKIFLQTSTWGLGNSFSHLSPYSEVEMASHFLCLHPWGSGTGDTLTFWMRAEPVATIFLWMRNHCIKNKEQFSFIFEYINPNKIFENNRVEDVPSENKTSSLWRWTEYS